MNHSSHARKSLLSVAVFHVLIFCVYPNWAFGQLDAVESFHDEQAWLAAIGGDVNFSLDFNTPTFRGDLYLTDAPPDAVADLFPYEIDPAPLELGLLRIQATRFGPIPSVEINQQTFFSIDGTRYLFIRTEADDDQRTRLFFETPVLAFGADVGAISNGAEGFEILIESVTGEVKTIDNSLVAGEFWGLVTDEPIAHVTFVGINADGNADFGSNVSLDNIVFHAVPEPTPLLILSSIVLTMALFRRKK